MKREGFLCTVRAQVTPEEKVHNKTYSNVIVINEELGNEKIVECRCLDCVAAKGGCKHAIALIFWLHRRTEEPSSTEVLCYWKMPTLSTVGTELKVLKASDVSDVVLKREHHQLTINSDKVHDEILKRFANQDQNSIILNMTRGPAYPTLSIHQLMLTYIHENTTYDAQSFRNFCSLKMQQNDCEDAEERTERQSKSQMWMELKYCRITASKLHESANCRTAEGSLFQKIFGATRIIPTAAMKRELNLEDEILAVFQKQHNVKTSKCGLVLDPALPIFGASPDGLTDECVIEIKSSSTSTENFVKSNVIAPRYEAQLQLQMRMCKKTKGKFIVSDPKFEENKQIYVYDVDYNERLCNELITEAENYWVENIFPKLLEINL